jgi:hypothetical protein
MEHRSFEMVGLGEYMSGPVEGSATGSGPRTPALIFEAPVNGAGRPIFASILGSSANQMGAVLDLLAELTRVRVLRYPSPRVS